ncbi:MAG: hypothetical protein ACREV5_14190 [Steroidobacter sp.]
MRGLEHVVGGQAVIDIQDGLPASIPDLAALMLERALDELKALP